MSDLSGIQFSEVYEMRDEGEMYIGLVCLDFVMDF